MPSMTAGNHTLGGGCCCCFVLAFSGNGGVGESDSSYPTSVRKEDADFPDAAGAGERPPPPRMPVEAVGRDPDDFYIAKDRKKRKIEERSSCNHTLIRQQGRQREKLLGGTQFVS